MGDYASFRFVPQGKALRPIIGNGGTASETSRAAILKAIARARLWYDQMVAGEATGLEDLASKHNVTPRYVKRIFRLASLGPAAVEAILHG